MSDTSGKGSKFKKFNLKFYQKSIAVPNQAIFNQHLKDSAYRLLCALEALPETWTIYQDTLAEMLGWGREKMSTAINILIEQGYVRRTQIRNQKDKEKGRFASFTYEFHWEPVFKENPNIQEDEPALSQKDLNEEDDEEEAGGGKPVSGAGGGKAVTGEAGSGEPSTSGFIDRVGSNNNILNKDQPTPKEGKEDKALVGGLHKESTKEIKIHQCLQKVNIPEKDKIRLTEQFDEATVSKSVAHCTKPAFKIQTSLDSSIFYFCRNPSHITETKEEIAAKKLKEESAKQERIDSRKYSAAQIKKTLWQKARDLGVSIFDSNEYIEIYNERIKEKIYYTDERFSFLIAHLLKKVGLEAPNFLKA